MSSTKPLLARRFTQVTGWADVPGGNAHAFVYAEGVMNDIGTLDGETSHGPGINDSGEVVGYSGRAFLYTGGVMFDLNTLVVNLPAGLILTTAGRINDAGQIAATGENLLTGMRRHSCSTPYRNLPLRC